MSLQIIYVIPFFKDVLYLASIAILMCIENKQYKTVFARWNIKCVWKLKQVSFNRNALQAYRIAMCLLIWYI